MNSIDSSARARREVDMLSTRHESSGPGILYLDAGAEMSWARESRARACLQGPRQSVAAKIPKFGGYP